MENVVRIMVGLLMIAICLFGYLCIGLGTYYVVKIAITEFRGLFR